MKPSYPWLAPLALLILVGASCAPDNKVKPGAPVLLSVALVDPATFATTAITGSATICPTTVGAGGTCDPNDPVISPMCRLGDSTWCTCVPDSMDMKKGNWACDLPPPTARIVVTFDRLLDTKPFETNGDAGPTVPPGIATLTSTPSTAFEAAVKYIPNGDMKGLVFGTDGPRLVITTSPTLPSGSTITLTLDKTKIRAKDGKTPFAATGLLADGILSFMTAPLTASITVPMSDPDAGAPTESDGGAVDAAALADADTDGGVVDAAVVADAAIDAPFVDVAATEGGTEGGTEAGAAETAPPPPPPPVMPGEQPVSIEFNNLTDPMMIPAHIKVTVNGAPYADVSISPPDDMHPGYTVAPKTTWPANSTIVITVDADAADFLGVKLGTPASATFVTGS